MVTMTVLFVARDNGSSPTHTHLELSSLSSCGAYAGLRMSGWLSRTEPPMAELSMTAQPIQQYCVQTNAVRCSLRRQSNVHSTHGINTNWFINNSTIWDVYVFFFISKNISKHLFRGFRWKHSHWEQSVIKCAATDATHIKTEVCVVCVASDFALLLTSACHGSDRSRKDWSVKWQYWVITERTFINSKEAHTIFSGSIKPHECVSTRVRTNNKRHMFTQ